ncbi:MAG: hypothetical protein QTN59_15195 [Candidatus Electrothrix communis]|nr:MAG: hypothetical protein QTN59_15195 [Candidatus Electrothrix communis]
MFDINLCLETPHAEINDFCDYMWQEFVCSIPPNIAATIKVLPYVDKKKCYTIFKQGKIATDQGGELRELPYAILTKALENIVSGHAINQIDKREIITLHSGVVSKNNKGILILGESGDGKSTFTLEMVAHHDWLYLTDEVGLLDNNFNLLPFLKTISYQPGIVQLDDKWMSKQLGMDHQLAVPKKKYGEPVPLKGIFFIKYAPESPPAIAPIKRSESLARLLNAQIGRAKYVATVEHMAEIVRRVNSYQIMHNDATEAACLVTELMETE